MKVSGLTPALSELGKGEMEKGSVFMAKVAIVTGGGRGIGAETAKLLAQQGLDVCIGYESNETTANAVSGACKELGRQSIAVKVDVSSEQDVLALFGAVDEQLGPVSVLVNNAGITDYSARVDQMSAKRIERMMAVNVVGSFLCAREAILRMSTLHGGSGGAIVNVSSALSRLGAPGDFVDYAASKGAIDTMTLGLAREVASEGIRVNAVRPGLINTEIHARSGQPDRIERIGPIIPMKRAGEAREVAETIAWLCSDAASYVTAALVDVSGGR